MAQVKVNLNMLDNVSEDLSVQARELRNILNSVETVRKEARQSECILNSSIRNLARWSEDVRRKADAMQNASNFIGQIKQRYVRAETEGEAIVLCGAVANHANIGEARAEIISPASDPIGAAGCYIQEGGSRAIMVDAFGLGTIGGAIAWGADELSGNPRRIGASGSGSLSSARFEDENGYFSVSTGAYSWEAGVVMTGTSVIATVGGSVSMLSGEGQYESVLGTTRGSFEVGSVEAEGKMVIDPLNGDVYVSAEAGVYLGKASIEHDFNVAGVDMSVGASGYVGFGANFDEGIQDWILTIDAGAALLIGGSIEFSVDLGPVIDFASDVGEAIGDISDAAEDLFGWLF